MILGRRVHEHNARIALDEKSGQMAHQSRGHAAALEPAVHAQPEQPAVTPGAARFFHHPAQGKSHDLALRLRHQTRLAFIAEQQRQLVVIPGTVERRPFFGGEQFLTQFKHRCDIAQFHLADFHRRQWLRSLAFDGRFTACLHIRSGFWPSPAPRPVCRPPCRRPARCPASRRPCRPRWGQWSG